MLPPGLSFNAISAKALAASQDRRGCRARTGTGARCSRSTRPATSRTRRRPTCCTGCTKRSTMLFAEGPRPNVFARHDRLAEATRRAVRAWGLEILCADPAEYSSSLTAVMMPDGHNADAFRKIVLERFDMSLGPGPRQGVGQGLPHRPSRLLQRPDAVRHAVPASRWGLRWPAFRTARAASMPRWTIWRKHADSGAGSGLHRLAHVEHNTRRQQNEHPDKYSAMRPRRRSARRR